MKLVVAPHADDEVLGCSSVLDTDTFVCYCGINEDYTCVDGVHRVSTTDKKSEISDVSFLFGFKYSINLKSHVNRYVLLEIKDYLENIINEVRPESVFISTPGFNQDHKTVYDAAMIALRPHDTNWFVKKVFVYESVHEVTWPGNVIQTNYYVPLDMSKKKEAYGRYKSQVRPYRSPELLESLAALKGASANVPYAEGFKILRWVE